MSITSLFNSTSAASAYGYGGNSATSGSSAVDPTTQSILDAIAKASGSSATTASNGVTISTDAKLAAANAADNKKDFSALATEVRSDFDAGNTDMTELSGRALAAVALNQDGKFSHTEIAAAKSELNGRTRTDFATATGGSGGLGAYNQTLVSQYDAMSDEERTARGWTASLRSSAVAFTQTSQTMSSLFDQLDDYDAGS